MSDLPANSTLNTPPSLSFDTSSAVPIPLFAVSVAVLITSLFAPQTMVVPIAASFRLAPTAGRIIATMPLLGYSAGLFFLVPLADRWENRCLVLRMVGAAIVASGLVMAAPNVAALLAALFLLGAACSAIQVLVPLAAHMSRPEQVGRTIGDVMSGLMIGILLARPLASFLTDLYGWRSFYACVAASLVALSGLMALRLPKRQPRQTASYRALVASMGRLLSTQPVLRQRALTAAIVAATFNFFWTSVAFILTAAPLHLSQRQVALFALVGAGGAVVTPLVGRWADRGWGSRLTSASHLTVIAGFGLAALGALGPPALRLLLLGLGALMIDAGVTGDQTVGRHAINQLDPEQRGRINGLFAGLFFIGGAVGSAASGLVWAAGGWPGVCAGGALLGGLALVVHLRRGSAGGDGARSCMPVSC